MLSGPRAGALSAPERLWTISQVQQGSLVQPQAAGRRKEGGELSRSGSWGSSANYPMCWVRGGEEGVRQREVEHHQAPPATCVHRKVGYVALSN